MAKLVVNPTSPQRRELSLPRSLLSIGRDPSNDLVLADAMVSRRHAVIELRGTQYFLRDCSSSNGSLVNGDRVSERGLRDGDLVAIGTARLLFREDLMALDPAGKVVLHPSAPRLRCPQCGADYRRSDLFCKQCGGSVQQAQPKSVCTACGTAVLQPARFCSACGGALGGEVALLEGAQAEAAAGQEATALAERPEASLGHGAFEAAVPPPGPLPAPSLPPAAWAMSAAAHSEPSGAPAPATQGAIDSLEVLPEGESAVAAKKARAALVVAAGGGDDAGAESAEPQARPRSRPVGGAVTAAATDQKPWVAPPRALREAPRAPRAQAAWQPAAADLGPRFLAGALDLLAVGLVQAVLLLPAGSYWWSRDLTGPPLFTPIALTLALLLLTLALGALYFIYLWGVWGTTPGKRLLGLAIEGVDGSFPIGMPRAAARFLGYLLSAALLGGGFLLIVLDGSGLHDRLAATRVVRRRS